MGTRQNNHSYSIYSTGFLNRIWPIVSYLGVAGYMMAKFSNFFNISLFKMLLDNMLAYQFQAEPRIK